MTLANPNQPFGAPRTGEQKERADYKPYSDAKPAEETWKSNSHRRNFFELRKEIKRIFDRFVFDIETGVQTDAYDFVRKMNDILVDMRDMTDKTKLVKFAKDIEVLFKQVDNWEDDRKRVETFCEGLVLQGQKMLELMK